MMIKTIILISFSILPICFLLLAATTFILAAITWFRQLLFSLKGPSVSASASASASSDSNIKNHLSSLNTALYCGRVSHTRFQPIVHSFSYPLFFCLLDLSEVDLLFNNKSEGGGTSSSSLLWPLNLLMTFRERDHLKNGEGLAFLNDNGMEKEQDEDKFKDISSRIIQLVSEKTNGKCTPSPGECIH